MGLACRLLFLRASRQLLVMAEEEIEQTLLIIKQCFVYKIPPRSTAAGHK